MNPSRATSFAFAALLLGATPLAACTPKTGPEVTMLDIHDKPAEMDGKYVTTTGLIKLSTGIVANTSCTSHQCTIQLDLPEDVKAPGNGYFGLRIEVDVGNGENEMQALPDKYDTKDLKVKAMGGKAIAHGDKVKVSGKLRCGSGSCTMGVERVDPA